MGAQYENVKINQKQQKANKDFSTLDSGLESLSRVCALLQLVALTPDSLCQLTPEERQDALLCTLREAQMAQKTLSPLLNKPL